MLSENQVQKTNKKQTQESGYFGLEVLLLSSQLFHFGSRSIPEQNNKEKFQYSPHLEHQ